MLTIKVIRCWALWLGFSSPGWGFWVWGSGIYIWGSAVRLGVDAKPVGLALDCGILANLLPGQPKETNWKGNLSERYWFRRAQRRIQASIRKLSVHWYPLWSLSTPHPDRRSTLNARRPKNRLWSPYGLGCSFYGLPAPWHAMCLFSVACIIP